MSIHTALNEMWWNDFGNKYVPPSKTKYIDVPIPQKKAPVVNDTIKVATTDITENTNFGKGYKLPAVIVAENRNAALVNTTFTGGTQEAPEAPEPDEVDAMITRLNTTTFDNTIPAVKREGESLISDPVLINHVNTAYNEFTDGLIKTSRSPGGRGGGGGHGSKLEIKRGDTYVLLANTTEEDADTLQEVRDSLTQLKGVAEGRVKEKISKDLKKINDKLKKGFGNPMVGGGGT